MLGSPRTVIRSVARFLLPLGLVPIVITSTNPAGAAIRQQGLKILTHACSSSTPIAFGAPPSSGTISDPSQPPVCFTFDADTGDTVFVNAISTSDSAEPTVTLLDPSGNVVNPNQFGGDYSLQSTGNYTLEVAASEVGSFNVYVQRTDDPANCTTVTVGTPAFVATISAPGQAACLQYKAPYTEWLAIRTRAEPTLLNISQFSPNGEFDGAFGEVGAPGGGGSGAGGSSGKFLLLIYTYGNSPATGSIKMNLASIQLSAWSAEPGKTEKVFASGFDPGESMTFFYMTGLSNPASEVICKTTVLGNGQPRCQGYLPQGKDAGAPGYHLIVTKGPESHHVAEATFVLK